MADPELFAPSLQHIVPARAKALPWRVSSQLWPAFFGGSVAGGILAWLNGRRLGLPAERQRSIVVATLVAVALSLAVVVYVQRAGDDRFWVRRGVQAVAVVLYLVLAKIQQPADRRHQMFGGQYAPMWLPGFLALFGGTLVWLGLVALLVAVSR